ncbi:MAG: 30S ribosomal protein S9 [Thermoplasmata archaeon]
MKPQFINTSGKRKTAVARAVTSKGAGRVYINKIPLEIVQPEIARLKMMEPIYLAKDLANGVDIHVEVKGGGTIGQSDAVRTAVARGLVEFYKDDKLKEVYKTYDRNLLVNDTRRKEPKHEQGRGARKRRQKSYR